MRATGKDDPALVETSWPMPDDTGAATRLRVGDATLADLYIAAEILSAYRALIVDGVGGMQTKRLKALRRVWRQRNP